MDCDSVRPPWPSCLGPKRDVGAGWKLTLPPSKERDPSPAGLGTRDAGVMGSVLTLCSWRSSSLQRFIHGALLCVWCCARLLGGRRGQGRHRIRGSGEFCLWMRDVGLAALWGRCRIRATAYRALPGRLPGPGRVSPLGQAWWGSLLCAWEPPVCSPPQADSAGQQGRCPPPTPRRGLRFGSARPSGACGAPIPWGSGVSYAAC